MAAHANVIGLVCIRACLPLTTGEGNFSHASEGWYLQGSGTPLTVQVEVDRAEMNATWNVVAVSLATAVVALGHGIYARAVCEKKPDGVKDEVVVTPPKRIWVDPWSRPAGRAGKNCNQVIS